LIRAAVAEHVGKGLRPRTLTWPGSARVDVDGVAEDNSVFVEIFAHQGALKGGQRHKVAGDVLKLITLTREYPGARMIIAFGDDVAARAVSGTSWLSEALRVWGVEVYVAELDEAVRESLIAAQLRQHMQSPSVDSGAADVL
jgi:hypothetical protein